MLQVAPTPNNFLIVERPHQTTCGQEQINGENLGNNDGSNNLLKY